MTAIEHTPGPWEVVISFGELTVRSANERDTQDATYLKVVERVGGLRVGPELDRSEEVANARLIAAAPELLEALISARNRIEDMLKGDDGQAWKEAEKAIPKINVAINKATGEAP